MSMKCTLPILAFCVALCPSLHAEELYKSIDSTGRVIYSDVPMPGGQKVTVNPTKGVILTAPKEPTTSASDKAAPSTNGPALLGGAQTAGGVAGGGGGGSGGGGSGGGGGGSAGGGGGGGAPASSGGGTSGSGAVGASAKTGTKTSGSTSPASTTSATTVTGTSTATSTSAGTSADAKAPSSGGAVKWHPGHYVLLYLDVTPSGFDTALGEVAAHPVFRGIQKRYKWSTLEPQEGQYDFSEIEDDLAKLAAVNRRLVIQVQAKSFKTGETYAPAYLLNQRFAGGVFRHENGYGLKLWNNAIRDRVISLVQALGARFNAEPFVEAVNLEETSPGNPVGVVADYDANKYVDNLIVVDGALRTAFPNTVVIQYTNYPTNRLPDITDAMKSTGVGLGGPDVFVDSVSLSGGVYGYYPQLSGVVPIGLAVQANDYTARYSEGPFDPPTANEIYSFTRNTLKTNYMFWLRHKDATTDYFANVLTMMAAPTFPRDEAGGLRAACPTKFTSCTQ